MLTVEEEQQKKEIIDLTEEVLEAKGIECDSRIAKLSEEKLREILEEVRKLRRKRKRLSPDGTDNRIREAYTENEQGQQQEENEVSYIR
jgi:ribosomal protein S13